MILFSSGDLYINFKNNNSKMILVTGISGSGKSTLSEKLSKKYNYDIVSFDMVFGYEQDRKLNKLEKDILNNFKNKYLGYESYDKNKICNIFFDYVKEYVDKRDLNIIFEGLHFLRRVEFDKIMNQRIIYKGTSLLVSLYRRTKRNINYILKKDYSFKRRMKEYYWLHVYNIKNIFRWISDELYFLDNVKKRGLGYEK